MKSIGSTDIDFYSGLTNRATYQRWLGGLGGVTLHFDIRDRTRNYLGEMLEHLSLRVFLRWTRIINYWPFTPMIS